MKDIIRIENLTKNYGKHRGVTDIDLTVKEGQWMGFIGPNGAGKSTVIRTLLGLIKPTEGKCEIFGLDCWKNREEIAKSVGYLPSEAFFYPQMTVSQTLDYVQSIRGIKDKDRLKNLTNMLELDTGRKISELSYGNRKKVAIVASLLHRPKLLVLDEPTGGLDPLMQSVFFSLLEEEHRNGSTIFMSSHILTEIENHAQSAIFIKEGRIILQKNVHEMAERSTKKVHIRGSVDLEGIEAVKDIKKSKDEISFMYSGKAEDLIAILSKAKVQDFSVTEPELEEVFMHYYAKEENK